MQEDNLKKHSSLLNNSDSDSEADGKTKKPAETNTEETLVNDFFNSFHNKYAKKILGIDYNGWKHTEKKVTCNLWQERFLTLAWTTKNILSFFSKLKEI